MFNLFDNLTNEEILKVKHFAKSDGWFNFEAFYKDVVENNNFSVFVEVGSWKGHSVISLAKALLDKGDYFELYAADWWDKLPKDNELWVEFSDQIPYLYNIYNYNLAKAQVRGHVFDLINASDKSADFFKDGTVDFVFLDASHDFKSVKRDIEAWKPKLRKGGILAGHDYHNGGVRPAIEATLDHVFVVAGCDVWHTRIK